MADPSNGVTGTYTGSVNGGYANDIAVEFQPAGKDRPPDYDASVNISNGKAKGKDEKEEEKKEEAKAVGTAALFRFARCGDVLMIFLGIFCSCVNGVALPAMIIVFGDMIDSFIGDGSGTAFLEEIPWELTDYTLAEAQADPGILQKVGEQLNMTKEFNEIAEKMMDDLIGQITQFAIYYCIIGVIVMVAAYGQVTCFLLASYRQTQCIRMALFEAILRQDVGWYDTQEIGELNTRLTDDVAKIQEGFGDKIGNFFQWTAAFVAGIVIGFVYGWKLTLVIIAVSPLLIISGVFMAMMTSKASSAEQSAYAKAGAVAEEVLGAIRTVTAFGGQKKECARYTVNLKNAKKEGVKRALVGGGGMGMVFLIMFACYALAFWYGAKLVRDEPENYTPGSMLIVFFAVLIGAFSIGNAMPNVQTFGTAKGAAYTIWEIIDRKPHIDSSSDEGITPDSIEGNVGFQGIRFCYPSRPDVQVLQGLDLQVKVGQTAALVGASGCGKSTTVQLLQRFYDPAKGTVTIDGRDIKTLNIRWLRQHIGVVSQEPILFGTTIAENIRYGRVGVTKAELEQACRMANAHNFISDMPKGYETLVGERGAQLSGGQKQRIAIARALVRDPKILLLDEATSALDTESEATVQEALDKASQGRTTLVIAHRLSTIKNADIIFGIQEGRVQESGSHNELMAQNGIYHKLVTNQKIHFKDGEEFQAVDLDDPASKDGLARQSSKVLKRGMSISSTGKGKKGDDEEKEDVPEVGLGRILSMNASEWYLILFGCIAAIGNGAIQPAFAVIFSEILGVFAIVDEQEKKDKILFYSMMFLVIGVVAGLSMFFQSLLFGMSGEVLTLRLRAAAFRAYMRQEIAYFDDHHNNVGALCTRLATDASAVQGATGARLGVACQSLSSIGAGIIIGFVFSWKLTLVILLFLPAIGLAGFLQMKIIEGYANAGQAALEGAGKVAVEAIENIRTVASLTKEQKFIDDYRGLTEPPYKESMKKAHMYGLSFSFSQALIYFAYAACFYFGAWLIENDGLEFQDMFKVFSAIVFGAMAMGQASHFAPDYGKAKTSANRIFFLLDREPEIDGMSEEGQDPGQDAKGAIRFEDVQFFYPTRPTVQVLKGLTLEASRGETVALVGSSGCGKSTSISLLLRFYDAVQGRVTLDGLAVNDVNVQWLRRQMGIVQQEPILFDTSIRENIMYGDNSRDDIPMDHIIAAARKANIHEFITNLPDGYETNVGDKGAQLSGGQKQRVAIARALVRDPKILLLDEATSALDTESEKVVQEALDKAREGRTCVMIAHRLSTVQNADRIVVIHNGQLCEQGTHSELLAQNGMYTRLNNAQQRRS